MTGSTGLRQCEIRLGSSDRGSLVEAGLSPLLRGHDLDQMIHSPGNILIAHIKRREPEAQNIRRAEVTDHAARDQGLHDRIAVRMGEGDLRTALRRVTRAAQLEPVQPAFDLLNE